MVSYVYSLFHFHNCLQIFNSIIFVWIISRQNSFKEDVSRFVYMLMIDVIFFLKTEASAYFNCNWTIAEKTLRNT